jgi:serine/threonine-protein kinase
VKVGDFGIAKAAESADLTQEGSFIGTAKYLAPEQVEGAAVDGRTDLYSLGVVLYEMLCGRVPFDAEGSSATALARLHQEPTRPRVIRPGVPRELEAICLKLLARQPDQRYSSATETRSALLSAGATDAPTTTGSNQIVALAQPPLPPPPLGPGLAMGPTDQTRVPPVPPPGARFSDTERRWLVPTLLVVLAAVSLGIAGLLISKSGARDIFDGGSNPDTPTTDAGPATLGVARATAFDPSPGDGDEHGNEVAKLTDGQAGTVWDTEWYRDRQLGSLKPGVGFYLTLDKASKVHQLKITSPSKGWSVQIYTADAPADTIEGWGSPRTSKENIAPGTTTLTLPDGGVHAGAVLVWITHLGEAPTRTGQFSVDIGEVQVLG